MTAITVQLTSNCAVTGIQVIVANPKTAGVARWIFLALWGSAMKKGDAAAVEYVTKVFENVIVQPRDAREASDVFYRQKARACCVAWIFLFSLGFSTCFACSAECGCSYTPHGLHVLLALSRLHADLKACSITR